MKKGTDVFDVKSALCSQGKLISENFRILKKNLSISSKGKHFGCVCRVFEDRLDIILAFLVDHHATSSYTTSVQV